jgi:hypothetical protein
MEEIIGTCHIRLLGLVLFFLILGGCKEVFFCEKSLDQETIRHCIREVEDGKQFNSLPYAFCVSVWSRFLGRNKNFCFPTYRECSFFRQNRKSESKCILVTPSEIEER